MGYFNKYFNGRFCSRISELKEGYSFFDLSNYISLYNINTPFITIKNKAVTKADPFLFVQNNKLYIFYEEQSSFDAKGIIKMRYTENLKNWTKAITVLEESSHLSFPFVFRDGNCVYMIPESSHDNAIRIYIANETLDKWELKKVILEGDRFVDSIIHKQDEIYYLFTSVQLNDNSYVLKIFYSKSLWEDWQLHPASNSIIGKKGTRNGGAIINTGTSLYRPVQDCSKIYGSQLDIFKIEKLDTQNYQEKLEISSLFPKYSFPTIGGHHFNCIDFMGKKIVATDYLKIQINYNCIKQRIKNKFL